MGNATYGDVSACGAVNDSGAADETKQYRNFIGGRFNTTMCA
jgi:hypothetical protein